MEEIERRLNIALQRQDVRQGRVFMNKKMADELEMAMLRKPNMGRKAPLDGTIKWGAFVVVIDPDLRDFEFAFDHAMSDDVNS